ncbi:MAG TPA: SRPBCC family protein [Gemmatimonadales bacterium]|nr:SRPBCC family protein [Gemmatimonadales bacterium]
MKWVLIIIGGVFGLVALIALVGAFVPREHRATSTVSIHEPADSVWKVVRDLGGITAWWPEIKESVRQPDQDGHEVWRQKMSGFDVPLVVMESAPPRRLVTKIDTSAGAAFGGTWTYELTSDSGVTRIGVTEAGWIGNPVFRFLSRFVFGYYGSLDGYLKALGKRFGEDVKPVHS